MLVEHNSQEVDSDDDPVVEEIPVFLSKALQDCYLLQYPVRPASMPIDYGAVRKAAFRPKHQQLEMHLSLSTANPNYDKSKGEQIALNVDGARGQSVSDSTFKSGLMDVQVMTGGPAVGQGSTGRYALGIVNESGLHLTEVKGVLSVRPNLTYLDKSDKRAKQEGRSLDPDDPDEEPEAKPEAVTVKFSKGESDRTAKWKEKSYQHMLRKEEEEQWIPMEVHPIGSAASECQKKLLFCKSENKSCADMDMTAESYLQSLK